MVLNFNWFRKAEKASIPYLEEIKLDPQIILPEPTRRELYDSAVREVQQAIVHEVILRELNILSIGPDVYEQTQEALKAFGSDYMDGEDVAKIKDTYPKAYFYGGSERAHLGMPVGSLSDLAHRLSIRYLSE